MDFATWLSVEPGRASRVAAHFRITPSAISQWKADGVPLRHMKALRDFTGQEVTLEEMVPGPDTPISNFTALSEQEG